MAVLGLFAGLILVAVMTARGVMAATAEDPSYEVKDTWQDNFRANFCVTAPVDLYGWKLKLKFEEAISRMQISRMRVLGQNPDKTEWTLGDEAGHNGVWREGERRCQDFIASKKGLTSGLQAEVKFVELPEDTECPEQVPGQEFTVKITQHDRNHLSGRFCLRVPRDFEDWKIRMEFGSKGINELRVPNTGNVTEVPDSLKMAWLLTPRNHNQVVSEGDTLCLDFGANAQRWIRPCLRAFFTEEDGETPIEVTLPSTTTLPETTPPPSTGVPDTMTVPETSQPSNEPDATTESAESATITTEAPPTTMEPTTTPEYGSVYTELQLWEEGVNGLLCLYHAIPITCGWEAEIVFDPAIDSIEIWRAGVVGMSPYQGSSNVVHLTNMTWNSAVSDNPLCLDFNAFKSYPEAPNSVLGQFTRICSNDQWVDIPGGTGLTPAPEMETTTAAE